MQTQLPTRPNTFWVMSNCDGGPRCRVGRGHPCPVRNDQERGKLKRVHSHGHSHGHAHGPEAFSAGRWWRLPSFVLVELVAGLKAHSLALLSDAGHNFTDALAIGLAWVGFYLQSKPADEIKTYGYHRASVLSAFVNALTLVALSVWILYESVLRLRNPEPVQGNRDDGGRDPGTGAQRRHHAGA